MDNWVGNNNFICFAFLYGARVSHTRINLLEKIKDQGSIFTFISASDIALAVLVYTNNFRYWRYLIESKKY